MSEVKPTALPWQTGGFPTVVISNTVVVSDCRGRSMPDSYEECHANAAFIVTACNSHADLLTMLKRVTVAYAELLGENGNDLCDPVFNTVHLANAVIAKAEGGTP